VELVKNTIVLLLIIRIRAAVSCKKKKSTPSPVFHRPGKGMDVRENPFRLAAARQSTFPKGTAYGNAGKFPVLRKASP
jgi:hypothetical protein